MRKSLLLALVIVAIACGLKIHQVRGQDDLLAAHDRLLYSFDTIEVLELQRWYDTARRVTPPASEKEREIEAREECKRRGLDPDDDAADGVLVWMVVDQELRQKERRSAK